MIQRALDAGVHKLYMPNCDSTTIEGMLTLEARWPGHCYPMIGLHPVYVKANYKEELNIVWDWLGKRRFYAIGEIASFNGVLYGITAAAEQQAGIMARYLNGDITGYYEGSLFMNILKMHGMELCSLGMVETPADPAYEEVVFIDKSRRFYKKCIIHQDRLVGAILIGDKSEFLEFRDLIQQKTELRTSAWNCCAPVKKARRCWASWYVPAAMWEKAISATRSGRGIRSSTACAAHPARVLAAAAAGRKYSICWIKANQN